MILRCTNKLLDVIRPEQLTTQAPDGEDWYANILGFDRRKCLLLTHADTPFTIFETDVRAATLRSTHDFVATLIERELFREGLPIHAFGDLRSDQAPIAKTADRRVLGCINDMAYLCEHEIVRAGSLDRADIKSLNYKLRGNMNSARDYQRPIDAVIERSAR